LPPRRQNGQLGFPQTVQGRRPRGARGFRVRFENRWLRRCQGRRRHRSFPRGAGAADVGKIMIVGSLRVRLLIRESRSLKDKRQVVRSIKDRLKNSFNVSIAEVDAQDDRRMAVLGFAMVGSEAYPVRMALTQIVEALRSHPVAEFVDYELE